MTGRRALPGRGTCRHGEPGLAGRSGISLVEAMVAIVLVGVVGVGTAGFFGFTMDTLEISRSRRIAFDLACSAIDAMRGGSYEDAVTDAAGQDVEVSVHGGKLYTQVVQPAGRDADYKEVKVRVVWQKGGRPFETSVTSILANAGRPR